jgi:hypothetical protein
VLLPLATREELRGGVSIQINVQGIIGFGHALERVVKIDVTILATNLK